MLLLFQTTEKICFCLKWKKGHNSPKFQNYYKMIVSASWWVLTDIVVKKISSIRQTVRSRVRTYKHTHKHTHSEKTEKYLTFFSMAQMVECSLIMWEVLGSKPSWVYVSVVVDVGAIFSIFRKWCKKSFFQKTNYQAT